MFSHVVVPVDLTGPCDAVLDVASTLARRGHLGLRLVTVSPPSLDHTVEEADLRALVRRVEAPSVATTVIESDDVVPALLEAAGSDGMLCMETRARGPLAAILLGSTASGLLQITTEPVLLVGPKTDPKLPIEVVEVCIDASDAATALVPLVAELSRKLGLRLRFVLAWHPSQEPLYSRTEAQEEIDAHASRAREEFRVPAESEVLIGLNAAEAIVDDAARNRASIIAVGTRRRSQLRRRALGSIALAVAHTTTATVLAVPIPTQK